MGLPFQIGVIYIFFLFKMAYCLVPNPAVSRVSETVLKNETDLLAPADLYSRYNVSVVTWNLAEKDIVRKDCNFLKRFRSSDLVVFGVQECEDIRPRRHEGRRSKAWKKLQSLSLGKSFEKLAQHKLGGIQLAVYAKKKLSKAVQGVQVIEVACGIGNVMSNKGAICVLLRIKGKTLAIINAHMAAHQGKVKERNSDYHRIMSTLNSKAPMRWLLKDSNQANEALLSSERTRSRIGRLTKGGRLVETSATESTSWIDEVLPIFGGSKTSKFPEISSKQKSKGIKSATNAMTTRKEALKKQKKGGNKDRNLSKAPEYSKKRKESGSAPDSMPVPKRESYTTSDCAFDAAIFLGDLNYRLDLPRLEVELGLLRAGLHPSALPNGDVGKCDSPHFESLLNYDQLTRERYRGRIFAGFRESRIQFPPTFKFDKGSDTYDSSSKARCPAWTDRVLYASRTRVMPPGAAAAASVLQATPVAQSQHCEAKDNSQDNSQDNSEEHSKQDHSKDGKRAPSSQAGAGEIAISGKSSKSLRMVDDNAEGTDMLIPGEYSSVPCRHSDHRPVFASFTLTV